MTTQQQLWLAWAEGQISDEQAQAAAEAHHAHRAKHPGARRPLAQGAPAAISEPARGPLRGRSVGHKRPLARGKVFGTDWGVPLDRNAKVRVYAYARALTRRADPHKHYGPVTAKALAVLHALLWGFHNAASGKCFPSYEVIAERAGCSRATVYNAIGMLERAGVLTWVNRLLRVRERVAGLFGPLSAWRWRVVRTSNSYAFNDPASKSKFQTLTLAQGQQTRAGEQDAAGQMRTAGAYFPSPIQLSGTATEVELIS